MQGAEESVHLPDEISLALISNAISPLLVKKKITKNYPAAIKPYVLKSLQTQWSKYLDSIRTRGKATHLWDLVPPATIQFDL